MLSEKNVKIIIGVLSMSVLSVVVILNKKILPTPSHIPEFVYTLPLINALFNASAFVLLLLALRAIRRKQVEKHKILNLSAFVLSALFLISYVMAHFYLPETIYGDINHNGSLENEELQEVSFTRGLYLIILITHITLAAITFPLILLSFYYGLSRKMESHKKIVRWAYPLWLYVCFTGPVIYVFLKPYYGF